MRLHFLQIHALGGIPVENLPDKVSYLPTQIEGKLDVNLEYLVIGLILIFLALKGRPPGAQLVAEHPQAPDISPLVIEIPSDDLRRHVVKGPTKGLSLAA